MKTGNSTLLMAEYLSLRSLQENVALILLETAKKHDRAPRQSNIKDIAVRLGTTPLQVMNSLLSMQENGLIAMERGRVLIKDRKSLHDITRLLYHDQPA